MSLTKSQWQEAVVGYGLEEVPRELRQEMVCCMCGAVWTGKLYTDSPIGLYATALEYRIQVDKMRPHCFCRYHAEQMFGL